MWLHRPHHRPPNLNFWQDLLDRFLRRVFCMLREQLNEMISKLPSNIKILQFYEAKQQLLAKAYRSSLVFHLFQHVSFPSPFSSSHSSFSGILSVVSIPGSTYFLSPQPGTPSPKSSHGWLLFIQVSSNTTSWESTFHNIGLTLPFHPILSIIAP